MTQTSLRCFYLNSVFVVAAACQVIPTRPSAPVIPPVPGLLRDTLTAKKLSPGEKLEYGVFQQFGIRGLVGSAVSAGIAQGFEVPEAWGPHWDGFGKRYASALAAGLSRQAFQLAMDDGLHQDPRYFPSSVKGFFPRFRNVLKQVLIAKKDDGPTTFATSRVASAFGSGLLANAWQPKGNGSFADGLERGGLTLGGDAAFFCLQEFFPFTRNSEFRHR